MVAAVRRDASAPERADGGALDPGAASGGLEATARDWPVGLVRLDRAGTPLAANPCAVDLLARLGVSPEAGDLFAALGRAGEALRAAAGRDGVDGGRAEAQAETADGGRVALTLTAAEGGALRLILIDQSAAASAERAARLREAQLEALAEAAPEAATYVLDAQGEVRQWSAAAERRVGAAARRRFAGLGPALRAVMARARLAGAAQARFERPGADGRADAVEVTLRALAPVEGSGFVALERSRTARRSLEAELRRLAETDALTGALNRRAFAAAAEAAAGGGECAVIALDMDGFKTLNDRFGHAAGDAALQALAQAASDNLREGDIFGRQGGDEFAAALPGADAARALAVAERLRAALEALELRYEDVPLRMTASFGVAAVEGDGFEAALRRADRALYRAKEDGRNRVRAAPPGG